MKKTFLFFSGLFVAFITAQTLPMPIYEATFSGSNWDSPAGFVIESNNIIRSQDQFRNTDSSLYLFSPHGNLQFEGTNASLKQEGTISFFVNYTNPNGTPGSVTSINQVYPILYLNNDVANASEGIMFGINSSGRLVLKSYSNATTGFTQQSSEDLYATQWHHIAISYKFGANGFITAYRNGKQLIHQNISHELTNNTNPFQFFGFTAPNSTYKSSLSGTLDEVRAYNESLNATQVKELYTSYFSIEKGSKIAKFDFNNSDLQDYFSNYTLTVANPVRTDYKPSTQYGITNTALQLYLGNGATSATFATPSIKATDLGNKFSIAFAYSRSAATGLQNNSSQTITPIISIPTTTQDITVGYVKSTQRFAVRVNGTEHVYPNNVYVGQFNYFVMTVDNDSKTVKLYINGGLALTINLTSELSFDQAANILIGKDTYATPEYMYGQIDDLIFVNKLYTQEEVSKTQWQWLRNIHSYSDNNTPTLVVDNIKSTQKTIKAYPNPTTDFVKLSEKADAELYDMSGKLLKIFKNVETIDLSAQKEGLYILKTSIDNKTQSIKIIKK